MRISSIWSLGVRGSFFREHKQPGWLVDFLSAESEYANDLQHDIAKICAELSVGLQ